MSNKIQIKAIKTDVGYYIQGVGWSNYQGSVLIDYYFDGKKPEGTFHKDWIKIPSIPTKIEKEVRQPNINYRYELIDKSFESPKVPLVLIKSEVTTSNLEDGLIWIDKYAHLQSLYVEKSDPQPNKLENVEFDFNIVLELDKIKEYGGFSYPVQKTRCESEGFINLTEQNVAHDEIDTIIFPNIILQARKSKLTSKQSYQLIRKYIQDNINPQYAKITSDYDFCFTVEKKIKLAVPEEYKKDISKFNARKPKYVTAYNRERSIKVFEMTSDEDRYKGYIPIKGFEGTNIEDLKQRIDTFLTEIVEKINEPLIDCPSCGGLGVCWEEKK